MFGIMFFVFCGLCGVIWELIKIYQNYKVRKDISDEERQIEKEQGYYHSMWGGDRDIMTGQQVIVIKDGKTGDECMYTRGTIITNGRLIKNISAEKRQKKIDEEKENGTGSVYWYDVPETHLPDHYIRFNDPNCDIVGTRYKDRKTGHIYVVRKLKTKLGELHFFMDITQGNTDGFLIRPCEDQYENINLNSTENSKIIQDFIDEFNKMQKLDRQNKGQFDFIKHYYCNLKDNSHIVGLNERQKEKTAWSH